MRSSLLVNTHIPQSCLLLSTKINYFEALTKLDRKYRQHPTDKATLLLLCNNYLASFSSLCNVLFKPQKMKVPPAISLVSGRGENWLS